MLSLPFSIVGGLWLLWALGFNLSVAVGVGFIALAGVAAETGVVMLIYLNHALNELKARCAAEGRPFTRNDLREAIMLGAVERVRPKMMTVVAITGGLLPIMWSTGTGSCRPPSVDQACRWHPGRLTRRQRYQVRAAERDCWSVRLP